VIGHVQLSVLVLGAGPWIIDNYRLSDFAENRQESIRMRMTPVKSCPIQTTHSKVTIKNPNAPCMSYHLMKHITSYHLKILAASRTESDYALGCCHSTCMGGNSACLTGLRTEINIKGHAVN